MKKFTLCFIIILIFSVFVYWLGLTQRKIEPDTFGVLQSKTGGLLEKPLLPGQKNWNWEFLLPTNARLTLFSIQPYNVQKTIKGQLPSGEIYSTLYNSNYTFDYSFTFNISVTLSPEAVISLIKQNQITNQDDLTVYLDNAANTVAQLAANYLLKKKQENPKFTVESLRKDELLKNIQIYRELPEVELYMISISESKIPDYSLYEKLQQTFFSQNEVTVIQEKQASTTTQEENKNDEKTDSN